MARQPKDRRIFVWAKQLLERLLGEAPKAWGVPVLCCSGWPTLALSVTVFRVNLCYWKAPARAVTITGWKPLPNLPRASVCISEIYGYRRPRVTCRQQAASCLRSV